MTAIAYEMTPEQVTAIDANPRRHVRLGRLMFSIGQRRDLPREFRVSGDRLLGWAGLHVGHLYAVVSWR